MFYFVQENLKKMNFLNSINSSLLKGLRLAFWVAFFITAFVIQMTLGDDATANISDHCIPTSSKYRIIGKFFGYINIDNVEQMHFDCDVLDHQFDERFLISIFFKPFFILNQTIDLRAFQTLNNPFTVTFNNLKGFDVEMNGPLYLVDVDVDLATSCKFTFINSFFDFYYQGNLIDQKMCGSEAIRKLDVHLFSVQLTAQFLTMYILNPVCPFVSETLK